LCLDLAMRLRGHTTAVNCSLTNLTFDKIKVSLGYPIIIMKKIFEFNTKLSIDHTEHFEKM